VPTSLALLAVLTELVPGGGDPAPHGKSADALTRATAARAAMVRGITAALTVIVMLASTIRERNAEAIFALSKWKFRPGTFNGFPTDVEFTLAISFRKN
jgi:hypothetical protein